MKKKTSVDIPSMQDIQLERKRIRRGIYFRRTLVSTVSVLVVVAAVAVLIATLLLPILQISGDSMSPTLEHDEIIVLYKSDDFSRGDLIGFYYQGKILVKRVIALPDETVEIDVDGNVFINGQLLDEPYVTQKSLGNCDLQFPYKVPGDGIFVLGDQRTNSVDSRNSAIGNISTDNIIGKVYFRVWPLNRLGPVT